MNQKISLFLGLAAMAILLAGGTANAMPMFARKLGVDCSMCHNPFPRLNKTGFEFRAAGFRLTDEIGKKEDNPLNFGDYVSARIKTDFAMVRSRDDETHTSTSKSDFQFKEVTFYPATGEFLGNWASEVELSFPPGEEVETENAYLKYAGGGKGGRFFTVRMGVFHPFEGYGASDRPIGLSRPLIETSKASGSPFKVFGLDQAGLELGYSVKNTRVTGTIFNGVSPEGEPNQTSDTDNQKDFQVLVNQMLDEAGKSAVSAYYYRGKAFPEIDGTPVGDTFTRWALFANTPLAKAEKLEILVGYGTGKDSLAASVKSKGWFGELRSRLRPALYGFARYDRFDPSTSVGNNDINAISTGVNWQMAQWVQLLAEFQHKTTEQGPGIGDKTDNSFRVEAVVIF